MRDMKTNRSLLKLILLSIITFGIFGLLFWSQYAKDMNFVCSGDGKKTRGIFARIIFSLITFGIYELVWMYGAGERIAMNSQKKGVPCSTSGGNVLLWYILGSLIVVGPLVAMHKLIEGLIRLSEAYNAGTRSNGYGQGPQIVINNY